MSCNISTTGDDDSNNGVVEGTFACKFCAKESIMLDAARQRAEREHKGDEEAAKMNVAGQR
jgi:hypothetical protein